MACCGQKTNTVKSTTTKITKVNNSSNGTKGLTPKNITFSKKKN